MIVHMQDYVSGAEALAAIGRPVDELWRST
jgi:hypothetical protein